MKTASGNALPSCLSSLKILQELDSMYSELLIDTTCVLRLAMPIYALFRLSLLTMKRIKTFKPVLHKLARFKMLHCTS
jgi:hypothetical protein